MEARHLRMLVSALIASATLAASASLSGCDRIGTATSPARRGRTGSSLSGTATVTRTTEQWLGSAHAQAVVFAAEEAPCAGCHDGGAFAMGVDDPGRLARDFPVATDCRVCHTGRGLQISASGVTSIPSSVQPVTGGRGALCMTCHNARRAPDLADTTRSAPHYGPQADVVSAAGGMRPETFGTVGSNVRHQNVRDTCVHCHMAERDGIPSHTFEVTDLAAACGCHEGITDPNRPARGDYDGNGRTEGLQDEVTGLLAAVQSATVALVPEAEGIASEQGRVVLTSTAGTVTGGDIPDQAYAGAYNYLLLTNDKSRGVHNPRFAVDLLQQTYLYLTGRRIGTPYSGGAGAAGGSGAATGTP